MSDESTTIDQSQAERASAKIYPFPPRGRYAVAAGPNDNRQVLPTVGGAAVSVAPRNAWYHEAALEAERLI
jgi:hypothetical protein